MELDKALQTGHSTTDLLNKMEDYTITNYKEEHENVEEKLYDLKNLIIKYLPETKTDNYCHLVLRELFELQRDLSNHSRIENLILLPKVEEMERQFKKTQQLR